MMIVVDHTYKIPELSQWHERSMNREYFKNLDDAFADIKRRVEEDGSRPEFSLTLEVEKE